MNTAAKIQHFEKLAQTWFDCKELDDALDAEHHMRLLKPAKRETGMDLACGAGQMTGHLAASGSRIFAVDLCDRMMKRAATQWVEDRLNNITILSQDAHQLEFANGLFDWVYCRFGLRYFEEPDRVMAELARVLKPGGRLLISDWSGPSEMNALLGELDAAHQKMLGEDELASLWQKQPLKLKHQRVKFERFNPAMWGLLAGLEKSAWDEIFAKFRSASGKKLRTLNLDGQEVLMAERTEALLERI
jgi:ubiquinone/menaquinone biosynthesis C-methylase UbiE